MSKEDWDASYEAEMRSLAERIADRIRLKIMRESHEVAKLGKPYPKHAIVDDETHADVLKIFEERGWMNDCRLIKKSDIVDATLI